MIALSRRLSQEPAFHCRTRRWWPRSSSTRTAAFSGGRWCSTSKTIRPPMGTHPSPGTVNGLLGATRRGDARAQPEARRVNAAQKLTYAAKTIEISATATSPLLSDAQPPTDRYLFRTVPNDTFCKRRRSPFSRTAASAQSLRRRGRATRRRFGIGRPRRRRQTTQATLVRHHAPAAHVPHAWRSSTTTTTTEMPFADAISFPTFEDPSRLLGRARSSSSKPIPTDALPSYAAQLSGRCKLAKPGLLGHHRRTTPPGDEMHARASHRASRARTDFERSSSSSRTDGSVHE